MSLSNLGNKIRREAAASPKKAAVLGLTLLVAGYFWAPLVWRLAQGEPKPSESATPAGALLPTEQASRMAPVESKRHTSSPWYRIVEWIDSDPLRKVVLDGAAERNPFQGAKDDANEGNKPVTVIETPRTPEKLGLTLTSTIIGQERSAASIGGKVYVEGETVQKKVGGGVVNVRLVEVRRRSARVEIDGAAFELRLASPESDKIQITNSKGN